jgi:predicted nucleotide-binding protein
MGQTVIEKFESNADVGFAVILLTPDDVGGKDATYLAARARQNVVLEFDWSKARI